MIRPAREEDLDALLGLGRLLHGGSSYSGVSLDEEKARASLSGLMAGGGVVFVAERDGELVGGIAGAITEHWFTREKYAFDYSLFVRPDRRHGITAAKLVSAFIEWARIRGASRIMMGITTNIRVEQTARFYRAMGLEDAGLLFQMEV